MALFGRSNVLAEALKRLEATGSLSAAETDTLLETVRTHPEFRIDRALWMLRSPGRKIREFAAQQLLARPDAGTLAASLVRELVATPPELRPEVARLAHQAAGGGLDGFLPTLVHANAPEKRDAALELLAAHKETRAFIPFLKVALHDPEPELRRKAVRILSRGVRSPSVFVILRDLIHDDDVEVRRMVIEAFARHAGPEIVEPFFERLTLEGERERAIIIGALSTLARTAQEEVEDRVLPMLSDESAAVREMAVRLLSEMPDRTRLLRAFLVHCRGLAFWLRDRSLASIRTISGSLIEALAELMRAGEDEDVRVGAMLLARGAPDERILPLVREIFTGNLDWWVRNTAAEVLSGFPGEEVTRLLTSRIHDPDLRYGIISLLGARPEAAAAGALLACLRDPSGGIRRAALVAFAQRGGASAVGVIAQVAAEDPDLSVRERAEELLGMLGGIEQGSPGGGDGARPAGVSVANEDLRMQNEELNAPPSS